MRWLFALAFLSMLVSLIALVELFTGRPFSSVVVLLAIGMVLAIFTGVARRWLLP